MERDECIKYDHERRTKKITLFEKELLLYERTILDVRAAVKVANEHEFADFMLISLYDALKPNSEGLKKRQRRQIDALISPKNLQRNLTPEQLYFRWIELQVLEGAEIVKCEKCNYTNLDRFPECINCREPFKKKVESQ